MITKTKSLFLTVVIPVFNEEKSIPILISRLLRLKEKINIDLKIIMVDDGSSDNTWEVIKKFQLNGTNIQGIRFSRNFGHQAAIEAGYEYADGDCIVTLDGDLQHPPELIETFVDEWRNGYDIVNAKRIPSHNQGVIKKLTSAIFYKFFNLLSETKIEPDSADFRLISKKVLEKIKQFPEKEKFIRGIVNWVGFKVKTVTYNENQRMYGSTGYTIGKMIALAEKGITSFGYKPMKAILLLGIAITLIGLVLFTFISFSKFVLGSTVFTGTSILIAFMMMSNGLITIVLGIISIYLVTVLKEVKSRPNYIISEVI